MKEYILTNIERVPKRILLLLLFLLIGYSCFAQQTETKKESEKWYDKIHFGGYTQVRYNNLFATNPNLECEQCDEFWGAKGGGLSLRRLRFKFYGQISPSVYVYLQPDFSKAVGESIHVARVKDAYVDVGLDKNNEYRIRLGQSKVPFGYEDLQTSSYRLPLDRNDALNSAVKDERDMGVFFYWASKEKRQLMKELKPYKNSGDFGVFAFGLYNGQTANHPDLNNQFHFVTRFSYPIVLGNQIIEPGLQAYSGKFVLPEHSPEVKGNKNFEYIDQRVAASFVLYPKPFGIQAEYNVGRGPEFNKSTGSIEVKELHGGYVTFTYFPKKKSPHFIPFTRLQYYNGGKKHELDARSYTVNECELGVECHPLDHIELVTVYVLSDRRYEDYANLNNHQKGELVRLQAQLDF